MNLPGLCIQAVVSIARSVRPRPMAARLAQSRRALGRYPTRAGRRPPKGALPLDGRPVRRRLLLRPSRLCGQPKIFLLLTRLAVRVLLGLPVGVLLLAVGRLLPVRPMLLLRQLLAVGLLLPAVRRLLAVGLLLPAVRRWLLPRRALPSVVRCSLLAVCHALLAVRVLPSCLRAKPVVALLPTPLAVRRRLAVRILPGRLCPEAVLAGRSQALLAVGRPRAQRGLLLARRHLSCHAVAAS